MSKGEFVVKYTNKNIMDKLEDIHGLAKITNGKVKLHTKLIWGSFGFTFAVLVFLMGLIT